MNKTEFKEVLSDILLGMATCLKRDPILILHIDGKDPLEFIGILSFEQARPTSEKKERKKKKKKEMDALCVRL